MHSKYDLYIWNKVMSQIVWSLFQANYIIEYTNTDFIDEIGSY